MISIREVFKNCKDKNESVLIGYVTCGFPTPGETLTMLDTLVSAGCNIIELGVPFSDPVADGLVIQFAAQNALKNGVTLKYCLEVAKSFTDRYPDVPLVLMGYANPFWRYGLKSLGKELEKCKVGGLIIPDLPFEHTGEWSEELEPKGVGIIPFLSPTTSDARINRLGSVTPPFIYCISQSGITGSELRSLPEEITSRVEKLRRVSNAPLAVGFGISKLRHIELCNGIFDGVVVGSAIIKTFNYNPDSPFKAVKEMLSKLRIRNVSQASEPYHEVSQGAC